MVFVALNRLSCREREKLGALYSSADNERISKYVITDGCNVQVNVHPHGHVDGGGRLPLHAVGGDGHPLLVDDGALAENVELDVGGLGRVAHGNLPGMGHGGLGQDQALRRKDGANMEMLVLLCLLLTLMHWAARRREMKVFMVVRDLSSELE